MSDNLKVVEFFIREFHNNNVSNIAFIAAPDFSFTLNAGPKQSFAECARRIEFLNERTQFYICDPVSKDDKYFYSECEIKLPNDKGELEHVYGKNEYVVENGLLCQLNARYYKSKEEYEEFLKLLLNSNIAFV